MAASCSSVTARSAVGSCAARGGRGASPDQLDLPDLAAAPLHHHAAAHLTVNRGRVLGGVGAGDRVHALAVGAGAVIVLAADLAGEPAVRHDDRTIPFDGGFARAGGLGAFALFTDDDLAAAAGERA